MEQTGLEIAEILIHGLPLFIAGFKIVHEGNRAYVPGSDQTNFNKSVAQNY